MSNLDNISLTDRKILEKDDFGVENEQKLIPMNWKRMKEFIEDKKSLSYSMLLLFPESSL